jgi:hypothetical protein
MVMISRYQVPDEAAGVFRSQAHDAVAALHEQPGWRGGELTRSVDEHRLWALVGRFADAGSLRRGLGAMPVRLAMMAIMQWAVDEPSVYEELRPDDPGSGDLTLPGVR